MTNSKTTKKALLSSALALLLCVSMLVGTTYAWFTDTAQTAVNTIQSGTLDVALEMLTDEGWVNAEGETLNFVSEDETILWEPGCTYNLPALRVVNEGNLALKYSIQITGVQGDAQLNEAIEWSITYPTTEEVPDSRAIRTGAFNDGQLLAGETSDAMVISGHMKETAGNEYQGLSISGIAITVHASQLSHEKDSTDDQYDVNAPFTSYWDGVSEVAPVKDANDVYHITNAAEFVYFVKAVTAHNPNDDPARLDSATTVLDCDIDLNGQTIALTGESYQYGGHFDGQGHTVSHYTIKRTDDNLYTGLFGYLGAGASVKNLTAKNATVIGAAQVGAIVPSVNDNCTVEKCHAINCTVIGDYKVGAVVGYSTGTVKDCTAKDSNVYCKVNRDDVSHGIVQAGEVLGYNNVNAGATFTGGAFENVNVYFGVTFVSTAAELKTALLAGGTVALMNDIDMSGWTEIDGSSDLVVDGNGYVLRNQTAPLFKSLSARNYTFKNVVVDGAHFDTSTTDTLNNGYGAFVGTINNNGGNTLAFENCTVKNSSIKAHKYAGAFVGMATDFSGTVNFTDCTVSDTTVTTVDSSCGGFIGHTYSNTAITNGAVTGDTQVGCLEDREGKAAKAGWFVGTVNGSTTTLTGCTVDVAAGNVLGNVNAAAALYNGFVGRTAESGAVTVTE